MSITYQEQTRQFPSSGTTLTRDGAPLSSRLGLDLITGVNNLAYVEPFAGYCQAFGVKNDPSGNPHRAGILTGVNSVRAGDLFSDGEYFMSQVTTVLPRVSAYRFCWTLGLEPFPTTTHTGDVTFSAVTVYISPTVYNGTVNQTSSITAGDVWQTDKKIDIAHLGPNYGTSINACNIVVAASTDAPPYQFINNSAGTTGSWLPRGVGTSPLVPVTLVLTTTMSHSGAVLGGEPVFGCYLSDFNWWVTPE